MQITKKQINLSYFFFSNRTWCTVQTSPITLWFRHWWTLCTMTSGCWWTLRTVASSTQPLPVWSCGCAIPTTPAVRALAFIFSAFQRYISFCSCSTLSLCYLWEIFALQLPFFSKTNTAYVFSTTRSVTLTPFSHGIKICLKRWKLKWIALSVNEIQFFCTSEG